MTAPTGAFSKRSAIVLSAALVQFGFVGNVQSQAYLTPVDSTQLAMASIWGVISDNGTSLSVTTSAISGVRPHLFLRKLNSSLQTQGSVVALTTDADPQAVEGITDHKHVFLNANHFVAFSTTGDQNLYLFKTDANGVRVGSIVTVVQGSTDPTNDMILATDGTTLFVLHFKPPTQHWVYKFTQNLQFLGPRTETSTLLPHNNIGAAVYENGVFEMVTGNNFGFGADVIRTRWNADFTAVGDPVQTLIDSDPGYGHWFSTGLAWDAGHSFWFAGYHRLEPGDVLIEDAHLEIATLNSSFQVLERRRVSEADRHRPHFAVRDGFLFMTYDARGNGVFVKKFQIQTPVGVEDPPRTRTLRLVGAHPVREAATLALTLESREDIELYVVDVAGRRLETLVDRALAPGEHRWTWHPARAGAGVYHAVLRTRDGVKVQRFVLLR